MKKLKIISIIITVLVAIGLTVAVRSLTTVKHLGNQLLIIDSINDWSSNQNSPIDGFVNIGNGLYDILTTHSVPLNEIEVKSELFDCFNESWTITHSIILLSSNSTLCIRLRYDPGLGKYHIVGYSGSIE